jgi:hypothetical protein
MILSTEIMDGTTTTQSYFIVRECQPKNLHVSYYSSPTYVEADEMNSQSSQPLHSAQPAPLTGRKNGYKTRSLLILVGLDWELFGT